STDPSSILPPAETLSLLVFNAPAPTAIYTLSLHDALPILLADGNDVLATSDAAGEAVRRARSGGGPTLLECRTYRTRPHAEGMGDYSYRTREEVAAWRERCPIQRYRVALLESGHAGATELDEMNAEVNATVLAASELAEKAPWPEARAAAMHTYSSPVAEPRNAEPGAAAGAG